MTLTWDPLLVEYMARELSERFRGRRAQALHLEPTTRTAVLFLEGESLSLELHPRRGTFRLFGDLPVFPRSLPLQLEVLAVRSLGDERVLDIELGRASATTPRTSLVVELMTNQWNAVVVDRRAGTIRTVLWPRKSGSRVLRSGQPYRPPQRSGREGATQELSLARWLEILAPVPPERRESILLQRVAYTSRLNARVLLGAAMASNEAADVVLEEGWRRWCALRERPQPRPCLLDLGDTVHPYPFPLPDLAAEPVASLLEAMARVDAPVELGGADDTGPRTLPGSAVRALQSQLASARRRLEALERRLADVPDPDVLRGQANLILSRLESVPRHVREATLEGFDGEPVSLRMDPRLTPTENAARLYDEAGRAERARERLPAVLTHTRDRVRRLEETLASPDAATVTPELLKELLPAELAGRRVSTGDEEPALPYRRYRTSGGLEVRVGRSARANDVLTFHHSRPDDLWLHARHAAGAHVILRWNRPDNPPARDLLEAATLAALHSRARTSGMVPVDWTRRKYVRKPRGSPPGAVVPDRVRTLFVEPDAGVERRLRSGWGGRATPAP
ncbi:MAG: DUF814 domain-containing protein [Gemmatimonadetes bacterium]|nr:DUF814 domain-containing protein [Gemmatimonadota bacterium]